MNATRTWTHTVVAAVFAIAVFGMSVSVAMAEKKKGDATGKSCNDKLHAAGLVCAKDYRECVAEYDDPLCDTDKESCETKAKNSHRACENAALNGTVAPAVGMGDTGGVLREPPPSAPETKGGTVAPSFYGTRKGSTP